MGGGHQLRSGAPEESSVHHRCRRRCLCRAAVCVPEAPRGSSSRNLRGVCGKQAPRGLARTGNWHMQHVVCRPAHLWGRGVSVKAKSPLDRPGYRLGGEFAMDMLIPVDLSLCVFFTVDPLTTLGPSPPPPRPFILHLPAWSLVHQVATGRPACQHDPTETDSRDSWVMMAHESAGSSGGAVFHVLCATAPRSAFSRPSVDLACLPSTGLVFAIDSLLLYCTGLNYAAYVGQGWHPNPWGRCRPNPPRPCSWQPIGPIMRQMGGGHRARIVWSFCVCVRECYRGSGLWPGGGGGGGHTILRGFRVFLHGTHPPKGLEKKFTSFFLVFTRGFQGPQGGGLGFQGERVQVS